MKKYIYSKGIAAALLMTATLPTLSAGDAKEKDFMWYCTSDEATEQQKFTVYEMMRSVDLDPEAADCQTAYDKINELDYILLTYTPIEDLSPISGFAKVETIIAMGTSITNLDGVTGLPNLTNLRLDETLITEFPDLARFPKVRVVSFYDSNLASLDRVGTAPNMSFLYVSGTNVADFSPLIEAKSLEWLFADDLGKPSALETLPSLPNLNSISVNGNGLTSLAGFNRFPKLFGITSIGSSIDSLDGLEGLTDLSSIELAGNKLRKIQNGEVLKEVDQIDFSHNPLEEFSFLKLLHKDLSSVDLSYTDFDDITAFYSYRESMMKLVLNGTNVREIPADFSDWPNLTILELMDTKITSFAAFKGIKAPRLIKFEGPILKVATEENCPTVNVPEGIKNYCELQIENAKSR